MLSHQVAVPNNEAESSILIIEDDQFQRSLLVRMASNLFSGRISVAGNGKEALAMLDAIDDPSLILCDLNMPEMDGVEFLRTLAQREVSSHIALVSAATKDVIESVKQMAMSYGLRNVTQLRKPVHFQQLATLLTELTQRSIEQPVNPSLTLNDSELLSAIDNGQMQPFFQPHICAKTGRVIGAEALIRWIKPDTGMLTPDKFLNRIFQLGLTHKLTQQVLTSSIKACAEWHSQGLECHVSVNVAPSDLVELSFADMVFSLLEEHNLPANRLILEVTETEICPHLARSLDTMSRLRLNGVGVSLDDFGTGHSSMIQLLTSPFTELKIDQFFVQQMLVSGRHRAAVESSLLLAKNLNLTSVAEGVETYEHVEMLQKMGCDVLQGFHYAKAMPKQEFVSWAKKHI
ncbi:EAL domain-containing protein [Corallincola holothuriorum]|uniref:EAL domain-containing protein n=1 Tax=Corallincola holothuriorum TaxID=2282215 RepID=A0A368NPH9_9GAMM|nr:EAL domain-containing response regulator [Corallincola holothuriorum]RCU52467.1 EAL domain-containing protein [Corallincola holothuriorum]